MNAGMVKAPRHVEVCIGLNIAQVQIHQQDEEGTLRLLSEKEIS
jgi:hypothetical protein